ncbi:MAG: hypothetical protein QM763_23710 [Agriterribacter sp.]
MKKITSLICALIASLLVNSQVQYSAGPELDNDRDNKLNRMIDGDDKSFYAYRIRSRGKGTSYYVERYEKTKLMPSWSKEITLDNENGRTRVNNVLYAQDNIYVFKSQYDKDADKMTLFYQDISSKGQVGKPTPLVSVRTDHYEFVDNDVYQNPSRTHFLIKSSHKENKESEFITDFILVDATAGMKTVWTKTIKRRLVDIDYSLSAFMGGFMGKFTASAREDIGFIGLYFDDKDNVYYCYTDDTKNSTEKERRYQLYLGILNAGDKEPKQVEIKFDDDYWVRDIEFMKSNDNEIVLAGYVKDVIERKGRDLVKVGLFSYKIDLTSNTVSAKAMNFFDDKMLQALESNNKRSKRFRYKLDYIFPIGDAVYYVGEQYNEALQTRTSGTGFGSPSSSRSYFAYEYMDVIIAKLNAKGQFEWIKNVPLRNEMELNYAHVFKQYIAIPTDNSIYILCDDHPKNMERYEKNNYEPSDLKSVKGIHGSNFVSNQVSLSDGSIKRSVIFENEDYCFAPIQERDPNFIPPSEWEIFVMGKKNEIFIYTEDKGRDRFGKLQFK